MKYLLRKMGICLTDVTNSSQDVNILPKSKINRSLKLALSKRIFNDETLISWNRGYTSVTMSNTVYLWEICVLSGWMMCVNVACKCYLNQHAKIKSGSIILQRPGMFESFSFKGSRFIIVSRKKAQCRKENSLEKTMD